MKADVTGLEPNRWCKFHIVKGYHTEDYYQPMKEIERLIQEEHLKKYVNIDSSHGPDKSNSHGRDNTESLGPAKMDESSQGNGRKGVR